MKTIKETLAALTLALTIASCQNTDSSAITEKSVVNDSTRIVSVNGTVSEVIAALGLLEHIVGTDVASTYPEQLKALPKVGHNKQISPEGILALRPDIIVGTSNDLKQETIDQLKQSGVRTVLVDHQYSIEGAKSLIHALAESLQISSKGDSLVALIDTGLEKIGPYTAAAEKPKVLFIYARGAGTMMVGGKGTQVDEMIRLAGGVNVAQDINDYKPLTSEALVAYNPDVILLFDSGLSSLGGPEGLLEMQGVKNTSAGKNKKIVEMDGQFLTGFGPRVIPAVEALHTKIN